MQARRGRPVLIGTDGGNPVLAVKQLGKGRIVTLSVRTDGLSPSMEMTPDQRLAEVDLSIAMRRYGTDPLRDLLGVRFHVPSRNGQPVKLAVSGDDADENLSVGRVEGRCWQSNRLAARLRQTSGKGTPAFCPGDGSSRDAHRSGLQQSRIGHRQGRDMGTDGRRTCHRQ